MAPPDVAPGHGAAVPAVARLGDGDTTHLCALDADGLGVSLTQSNALDFGSHLVEPTTGVFLHNRGVGFSLVPGHPAEVAPGRRPPHTLSPMLVTTPDGALTHLVGAMGATPSRRSSSSCWPGCCRGTGPGDRHHRSHGSRSMPLGRAVPPVVGR